MNKFEEALAYLSSVCQDLDCAVRANDPYPIDSEYLESSLADTLGLVSYDAEYAGWMFDRPNRS